MDSKLFINWFENDFIKNVKKWQQDDHKAGKILMFFPLNVTSLIQPID